MEAAPNLAIVPCACDVCGTPCPPDDRLPFRGAVAHFACIGQAELYANAPRGRVVVLVGRRGKWAKGETKGAA